MDCYLIALPARTPYRFLNDMIEFLVMPLLMFNILYGTIFTFIRRALNGENLMDAHRDHLYQLLIRSAFTHREVALIYCCMTFLQGLGAMWMVLIPGSQRAFIFFHFCLCKWRIPGAYTWGVYLVCYASS